MWVVGYRTQRVRAAYVWDNYRTPGSGRERLEISQPFYSRRFVKPYGKLRSFFSSLPFFRVFNFFPFRSVIFSFTDIVFSLVFFRM